MHKLSRGAAPTCLANYRHGLNNWGDVTSDEKKEIWVEIKKMQGQRCAYCEKEIDGNKRHIEHFHQKEHKQKGHNPKVTFQWSNLFGSCNQEETCGKYKDRQKYDSQHLIKPDEENPEDFLFFTKDGSIHPRKIKRMQDQINRAIETIRIFHLDFLPLERMRASAVAGYIQTAEAIAAMANELPEDEWRPLAKESLAKEVAATAHLPFATAIKHVLTNQST